MEKQTIGELAGVTGKDEFESLDYGGNENIFILPHNHHVMGNEGPEPSTIPLEGQMTSTEWVHKKVVTRFLQLTLGLESIQTQSS